MTQFFMGIAIILFGFFIGGVGLASAAIGVGIPMIPLGIYIAYRGGRVIQYEKRKEKLGKIEYSSSLETFEKTKLGKTGLGILLILIGIGASPILLIGVPIILAGLWLTYSVWKTNVKLLLNRQKYPDA
jgi:hypothetical protein